MVAVTKYCAEESDHLTLFICILTAAHTYEFQILGTEIYLFKMVVYFVKTQRLKVFKCASKQCIRAYLHMGLQILSIACVCFLTDFDEKASLGENCP